MGPDQELDALLKVHQDLRPRLSHAWNAFFAGFGSLRPVQLQAIPAILSGRNVLVTAPTAGGKTEAVLAPICERLACHRWSGLSVIVITPTRALVNDLYMRLQRPLENMRIRLGRKTADHGIGDEIQDQVLITTPESVESMLDFRRELLESVQAIVIDEIHLLDGSPRGDQLRSLLNRISLFRHHIGGSDFAGLHLVAMSATVSNPRRLADAYLGKSSEIVTVGGQRDLEARILVAAGTDDLRAEEAIKAVDEFSDVHKILVFVNSRKQVDTAASYFRSGRFSQCPVYGHHGSLSKSQREETETRFKSDSQAICVATMTLEVGIDIGDIDLVICMDPPFSLASFLQRIGRGCRRLHGRTRVLCVARDRAGELTFDALIRQATLGMPAGPTAPFRRSVLLHQVLAYLKQAPKHRRITDQFLKAFSSDVFPTVTEKTIREVLDDMVQMGFVDKQGDVYVPASEGWDFIGSNRIYANIQSNPLEVDLVDVESGKVVAKVAGVADHSGGIRVAGRSYNLVPGGSPIRQRVRGGGNHDASPKYHARSLPYAFDIGASLCGFFGIQLNEIVAIRTGGSLVVMTWLGKLHNAVLAEGFKQRGYRVADGPFHLTVEVDDQTILLDLLREAVKAAINNNPLGTLKSERMVDVGPHFKHLSPQQQKRAREEWLDDDFLRRWCSNLTEVRVVPGDSELAADLMELT